MNRIEQEQKQQAQAKEMTAEDGKIDGGGDEATRVEEQTVKTAEELFTQSATQETSEDEANELREV